MAKWAEHCGFKPAAHHRMLIEYLEKVARGEIDRLAVFMPPGSAKSRPMPQFCFRRGC